MPASRVRVVAIRDWPGHFRARIDVPPGGLDRLETGMPGTVCENDVCRPDDWIIPVVGAGPPPDAPITTLAEARIDVGDPALAADEPTDLSVVVRARANWESVPLPAQIVVRAREPRGPNVATVTLPLADPATAPTGGRSRSRGPASWSSRRRRTPTVAMRPGSGRR